MMPERNSLHDKENKEMDSTSVAGADYQDALMNSENRLLRFQMLSSLALGTLSGLLIGLPVAQTQSPTLAPVIVIGFGFAGLLIGYRRRKDRAFLYICFMVILVLSGTISTSLIPEQ